MGAGKAIVSTPYWNVVEALAESRRGKTVPFHGPPVLATVINDLFDHALERHAMRKAAYTPSAGAPGTGWCSGTCDC